MKRKELGSGSGSKEQGWRAGDSISTASVSSTWKCRLLADTEWSWKQSLQNRSLSACLLCWDGSGHTQRLLVRKAAFTTSLGSDQGCHWTWASWNESCSEKGLLLMDTQPGKREFSLAKRKIWLCTGLGSFPGSHRCGEFCGALNLLRRPYLWVCQYCRLTI